MYIKVCESCNEEFNGHPTINDKKRNLGNRKYCLTCSPFNEHNTRTLDKGETTETTSSKYTAFIINVQGH